MQYSERQRKATRGIFSGAVKSLHLEKRSHLLGQQETNGKVIFGSTDNEDGIRLSSAKHDTTSRGTLTKAYSAEQISK